MPELDISIASVSVRLAITAVAENGNWLGNFAARQKVGLVMVVVATSAYPERAGVRRPRCDDARCFVFSDR
jgi:hypothetical protein